MRLKILKHNNAMSTNVNSSQNPSFVRIIIKFIQFSLSPIAFAISMLASCILGLAAVYLMQYQFGFSPCHLCIVQRKIVAINIAILTIGILLFAISKLCKKVRFSYFIIVACIAFFSAGVIAMNSVAVYHVGVEAGVFQLDESCATMDIGILDPIELERAMMTQMLSVSCDRPQILFGLSVATWTIMSTAGMLLATLIFWANFVITLVCNRKKS